MMGRSRRTSLRGAQGETEWGRGIVAASVYAMGRAVIGRAAGVGAGAIAALASMTFGACSASDIEVAWMVPDQIGIEEPAIYRSREFGICAVSVFRLSDEFATAVRTRGADVLNQARTSREAGATCGMNSSPCALEYASWNDGALLKAGLDDLPEGKALEVRHCLADVPDIQSRYERALNTGGGIFTFAKRETGRAGDEVLVILPQEGIIIVEPH